MADLDGRDPGGVEGGDDPADLLGGDPMPDGVHPVPERDVLDIELRGHAITGFDRSAIRSATRIAAEVMMSRFPA